jgi:membrane dipeptidase
MRMTGVDHIVHVAEVAGIEHVGLGPDFIRALVDEAVPGVGPVIDAEGLDDRACIPGLEGPRGLPAVTDALLARGIAPDDVRAAVGANVQRLFRAELGRRG